MRHLFATLLILHALLWGVIIYLICAAAGRADAAKRASESHPSSGDKGAEDDRA